MNSPIDDDKIYEARNFARNGPNGLQTVLEFREVLVTGDLMSLAGFGPAPTKSIFRGRGEAPVKIPAFNGQPAREGKQPVDFKIDALTLQQAFELFEDGLKRAQAELQADVDQQVRAMQLQMGAGQGRGIFKPN